MATPAAHKSEAETILAAYEADDPGKQYAYDRTMLARVHAELSRALGTGTHYAAAEAALTKAAATTVDYTRQRSLNAALAHASLADR